MTGFADQRRACLDGDAECKRVTWRAAGTIIESRNPDESARRYAHEWDMPYWLVRSCVTPLGLTPG